MPSLLRKWPLPFALLAISGVSGIWYKMVSKHVPDPYLVNLDSMEKVRKGSIDFILGRGISCTTGTKILQE